MVHAILDEARTCHVAWSSNGQHYNLPQIFARVRAPLPRGCPRMHHSVADSLGRQVGDVIFLHGSVSSSMVKAMRTGGDVCFTGVRAAYVAGALPAGAHTTGAGSHAAGRPGAGQVSIPSQVRSWGSCSCSPRAGTARTSRAAEGCSVRAA